MERLFLAWVWGFSACVGAVFIYIGWDFMTSIPDNVVSSLEYSDTAYQAFILTAGNWGMGLSLTIMCFSLGLLMVTMGKCLWLMTVTYLSLAGLIGSFGLTAMLETMRQGEFFLGIVLFFALTGAGFCGAVFAHLAMEAIFKVGDEILK